MPVIVRFKNIRFVVYPKDHGFPHVHIIGQSSEAKFRIDVVECMDNKGFSEKALNEIEKKVIELQELLLEAWNDWQE